MLRHFEHQRVVAVLGVQGVQDLRQIAVELHVNNGADDLGDRSPHYSPFVSLHSIGARPISCQKWFGQSASAPEMISINSLVIAA